MGYPFGLFGLLPRPVATPVNGELSMGYWPIIS
jgi:hypothetical protein